MLASVSRWLAPRDALSPAEAEFERPLRSRGVPTGTAVLRMPDVLHRARVDPVMAWKLVNLEEEAGGQGLRHALIVAEAGVHWHAGEFDATSLVDLQNWLDLVRPRPVHSRRRRDRRPRRPDSAGLRRAIPLTLTACRRGIAARAPNTSTSTAQVLPIGESVRDGVQIQSGVSVDVSQLSVSVLVRVGPAISATPSAVLLATPATAGRSGSALKVPSD